MAKNETIQFSKELDAFIEEWKNKPGNLIMILHKVQEEFGYISKDAARVVSERTGSTLARVYGVMTFYHFFKTQKPGQNKNTCCFAYSCFKTEYRLRTESKTIFLYSSGGQKSEIRFSGMKSKCHKGRFFSRVSEWIIHFLTVFSF